MKSGVILTIIIIAVLAVVAVIWSSFYSPQMKNASLTPSDFNSQGTAQTPVNPEQTTPPADTNPTPTNAQSIKIQNFAFSPATITISAGTTVEWTNLDSVSHTVTSDSGSELNSQLLPQGESYSHTFNTPGTYTYHCTPHPNMKATVIVQ